MKYIKNWNEIKRLEGEGGKMAVIYELDGYRVRVADASYNTGGYDISVTPIEKSKGSYLPDIYVGEHNGRGFQEISIQTTSYGALKPSEIDKVIKGYQTAQSVAREIEAAFPECFDGN